MASLPRVAFQGEAGAYSEAAALALWEEPIETVPCESFEQVYECVESGECDYAMLPVENSLAGSIHRNYDLLLQHDLSIIAEHNQHISHCVIAHHGVDLREIKRVYSHPQALAQCAESLRGLNGGVQVIAAQDTAGSVAMIKREGWRDAAAIAGERAAELYEMAILQRDFEDEKNNYTRFIALSREPVTPTGDVKTSLAFAGHNVPGVAVQELERFFAARYRPDQDRIAAAAGCSLAVCVLPRFCRQYGRGALPAGGGPTGRDGHLCQGVRLIPARPRRMG